MRLISSLLLCSASVIGVSTTPALAQDNSPEATVDSSAENVIVVQARRRDEAVQDVPAVINTVTSEQVSKLNIRDFQEVSSIVPGLQLGSEANGIGGNARLRGVNFDVTASGNNPTVEFYFNDAPINAGVILQQMYDIGQIEVQRGPQGTLRGRASPSGSITITAKKPDLYKYGGFIDMTANDIGTINVKGAVNVPIIEGVAAIRAAGVWDENEADRVRPIGGGRDPFARTKSGRISALVQPTDWLKLEGLYQRVDRKAYTYDQVASFSEGNPNALASPVYISTADRLSTQQQARPVRQIFDIYNWRSEISAMGQVLIYQGQHYTQKISSTANQDAGNFFPGDINQVNYSHPSATSHEVRLQNGERLLDMFDYVVGYFDYKNNTPTEVSNPSIIGRPVAGNPNAGTLLSVVNTSILRTGVSHERSIFGNLTVHFGENTEIAGGVRHIDFESHDGLYINGPLITSNRQDAKKWIYSASIKHNFTPDLMVYASTGSSWRPGINVVGDFSLQPSALESSFLNLPAETSKSYEIGVKSTLFGGKVRANLTAFHQKFKNYPYRVGGRGVYFIEHTSSGAAVNQFNFVGAVPVEVNGLEGDITVDVVPGLTFGATASYSLGKIKNGTIPCTDLNGDGVPDTITAAPSFAQLQNAVGSNNLSSCNVSQRSAFLPPFSATVTSEYEFAVNDNIKAYLRGLLSFNGSSQSNPANPYDNVGAYGLFNLFTGIRDPEGAWEISLFAKNLFDTNKTLTRSDPLFTSYRDTSIPDPVTGRPSPQTYTSTYTSVSTTAPREFGINVRYAFGSR